MNTNVQNAARPEAPPLVSELLILPDGRILVHNLTPAFARVLQELNPADTQIQPRAESTSDSTTPHVTDICQGN